MFDIKRIIVLLLSLSMAVGLTACKEKSEEDYIESGELVVLSESSDIKFGIYDIDTLNPLETKAENVKNIMNIIYEPLFTEDETKTSVPVLASGFSSSSDGRQITVNLKEGVKWQDGTVFTADDVVYTLSKMCTSEGLYRKTADKIRSFTATEKMQVVINFENPEPNPELLLNFPVISKKTAYIKNADFVPMGTGSYKFASKSSTEIILEPNSVWHGGEVSQKQIVVKILKDKAAASEAFNVNELDAITSGELSLDSATPKTNARTEEMVSDNMVFLGFNTKSPILVPINIRKAIGGLIDKKKLLENDVYGHGKISDSPINPSSWAYQAKGENEEDYAENLIMSEGYMLSDGIYYKEGMPLLVRILVNADNAQRAGLADSIADTLKTAGFAAHVEKLPYNEYIPKIINDDFDIFIGEVEVEPNLNPASMLDSGENYFNFDTSILRQEMSNLVGVVDKEAYKNGIVSFMLKFYADPPYIPLYFKSESVIYGSYVSGTDKPSCSDPYGAVEKWYFYEKSGKQENGENSDE